MLRCTRELNSGVAKYQRLMQGVEVTVLVGNRPGLAVEFDLNHILSVGAAVVRVFSHADLSHCN